MMRRLCVSLLALVTLAACGSPSPPLVQLPPDAAAPCPPGFVPEGDGCRDVNECAIGTDSCAPAAVCENTPGGYTCHCPDGYTGDGQTCTDIDECASPSACPPELLCTNLPGSHVCTCPPGSEQRDDACEPLGQLVTSTDRVCAFHDGTLRCHDDVEPLLAVVEAQGGWLAGTRHNDVSCAIDASGQAFCAGNAFMGRIGDGTIGDGTSSGFVPPRRVSGGHRFVHIEAGPFSVCAIDDRAQLWCWGRLIFDLPDEPVPVLVPGDQWAEVSIGAFMTCALRVDGSMWCWNSYSSSGASPQAVAPVRVGVARWRSVRLGYFGACAIAADASLWCWGKVFGHQRSEPQPVLVDASAWRSIDVGTTHACGVRTDGTLWCWGSNDVGQVGAGASYAVVPTRVDDRDDYREVRVDVGVTCATRRDGSTWCVGGLDRGVISHAGADSTVPLQVGTSHDFVAVATSLGATCAIDGSVLECWGDIAVNGQDRHVASLPEPVPGQPGGVAWQAVTNDGPSICAESTVGDVWCNRPSAGFSGRIRGFLDEAGGFGRGLCALDLANQIVCPYSIALDLVPGDWRVLSSGSGGSTCGIDAAGHLFCWGANSNGELGDGTTSARTGAVPTGGDAAWVTVRAFYGGACALRADRTLWCWGLPPGLSGPVVTRPTELRHGERWTVLSGSDAGACAIREDGSLWCWGTNFRGDQILLPERVGSDTWRSVTCADAANTCAIRGDGTLWCWGFNSSYQLGQGSFTTNAPVLALPSPAAP
jgi:Calcium-binding EGF domain/Regulator of chromosome condensation (RCC1) repeat